MNYQTQVSSYQGSETNYKAGTVIGTLAGLGLGIAVGAWVFKESPDNKSIDKLVR